LEGQMKNGEVSSSADSSIWAAITSRHFFVLLDSRLIYIFYLAVLGWCEGVEHCNMHYREYMILKRILSVLP